jgi:hypothetical protein
VAQAAKPLCADFSRITVAFTGYGRTGFNLQKSATTRTPVSPLWDAPISCTRRYERLGWGIGIGDSQCCWSEAVGRTEAALRSANSDGVR